MMVIFFFFILASMNTYANKYVVDTIPSISQADRNVQFDGGPPAWRMFLVKNIQGDIAEKNKAPAGKYQTVIRFVINVDGSISNIEIVKDPGYGAAEELSRVIKLSSGKWIAAMHDGKLIRVSKIQRLTFEVSSK